MRSIERAAENAPLGKNTNAWEIAFSLAAQPLIASRENAFVYDESASVAYQDKETGLAYNMARDYASEIGRYIESDPIELIGGINTYAYVASNPLSYMDPEGLQIRIPRPKIPGFPGTSSGGGRSSDSTGSRELDEALGIPHPSGASTSASSSSSSSSSGGQTLEECYAQCEEDQKERDALCYSLKYMKDKSKQAQCLKKSFEKTVRCYTECRKTCK